MAKLILGPMLRYVSETEAVVWVETDEPCAIEVLDARDVTFEVCGHHYGLVIIEGLEPGSETEYEVALDGERRWPDEDSDLPPSAIRTMGGDEPLRLAFGSCRVSLPHHAPFTLTKDEHDDAREMDALFGLVQEMRRSPRERWPRVLAMIGDQVYADEVSPETVAFIRKRRDIRRPPGEEVADFEEFARLYRESWEDPPIRWLLANVSSAMVIDDHDVNDDWNISQAWVEQMRKEEWWPERECAGIVSYWLYQFIGNLSPELIRDSELLAEVRAADDGWEVLEPFARDERGIRDGARWSYCRDLGPARLVVVDSRLGRVLEEGNRSMLDEDEWAWLENELAAECEHLLIATSDPFLLAHALHNLERWGEAVCAGAWGGWAAKQGERLRQGVDFDHWAAFGESFDRLARLIEDRATGRNGRAPRTITLLSGDVHHAYLAEVEFSRSATSSVWQAVCSPFRNALDSKERRTIKASDTPTARRLTRALARAAGVPRDPIDWRIVEGPFYDNQVATLTISREEAEIRLERTVGDPESDQRELHTSFERSLR